MIYETTLTTVDDINKEFGITIPDYHMRGNKKKYYIRRCKKCKYLFKAHSKISRICGECDTRIGITQEERDLKPRIKEESEVKDEF